MKNTATYRSKKTERRALLLLMFDNILATRWRWPPVGETNAAFWELMEARQFAGRQNA